MTVDFTLTENNLGITGIISDLLSCVSDARVGANKFIELLSHNAELIGKRSVLVTPASRSIPERTPADWLVSGSRRARATEIADCLTSLDELIAAQARKLEALKTHKKGLMQQLFPAKAKPNPASASPNSAMRRIGRKCRWEKSLRSKLGKMLDANKHKTGRLLPATSTISRCGGMMWIHRDLPQMYFNDDELERYALRAGDVLVCEGGEPGRAAVWDGRVPDLKFQKAVHRVRFRVPFEPKLLVLDPEAVAGTTTFERVLFTGGGIKAPYSRDVRSVRDSFRTIARAAANRRLPLLAQHSDRRRVRQARSTEDRQEGPHAAVVPRTGRGGRMSALATFHADIKNILEQARGKARSAVNAAMVEAYWRVGQRIVEEEQRGQHKAEDGTRLIEDLSTALTADLGKGFSYANRYNCRQFYLTFPDQAILYTVRVELYPLLLIMRVDSPQAIEYYCHEAREQTWTVRQLERNIKSRSFQRLLSTQADQSSSPSASAHLEFIKDPYVLEFLQLPEEGQLKESRLEQAIIDELQKFLLELGKRFSSSPGKCASAPKPAISSSSTWFSITTCSSVWSSST